MKSEFQRYVNQILSEGQDDGFGGTDVNPEDIQQGEVPNADTSPTPEEGATTEKKTYDKPYKDLANIAYKALRTDFDKVPKTYQDKLLRLDPEDTTDDEKGVAIFQTIEEIVNDIYGVEPENADRDNYGPAV